MPQPVERVGRPASPRSSQGRSSSSAGPTCRPAGRIAAPLTEASALKTALESRPAELRALHDSAPADAQGIVEFQPRHARRSTLLEPVMERIMTGRSAANAWQGVPGLQDCRCKRPMTIISGRGRAILPISRIACCVFLPARRMPRCRPSTILIGEDLPPSRFLAIDWSKAGCDRARARQPAQPCRHPGAGAWRADGDRPRRGAGHRACRGYRRRHDWPRRAVAVRRRACR